MSREGNVSSQSVWLECLPTNGAHTFVSALGVLAMPVVCYAQDAKRKMTPKRPAVEPHMQRYLRDCAVLVPPGRLGADDGMPLKPPFLRICPQACLFCCGGSLRDCAAANSDANVSDVG